MGNDAASIGIGNTAFDRLAHIDLVHQVVPGGMFRELFNESERFALNAGSGGHLRLDDGCQGQYGVGPPLSQVWAGPPNGSRLSCGRNASRRTASRLCWLDS